MIRRPPRSTLSLHDALPISLDAVIQTFNAVSMLRQQVRPECRIHGIITNGGAAPNIIPEVAAATFYVRAPRIDGMWTLHARVGASAGGPARAPGCTPNGGGY